jgi:hypothetical protein
MTQQELDAFKLAQIGDIADVWSERLAAVDKQTDTARRAGQLSGLMRGMIDAIMITLAVEDPGTEHDEADDIDPVGPAPRTENEQAIVDQLHDIVNGIGKGVAR